MATVAHEGGSWIRRMKGAALLDVNVYEEVEADSTATTQAAGVVAIVALAQGIGSAGEGGGAIIGGIIAIRQALDFSTGKAVLTAVLGWMAVAIPMLIVGAIAG